MKCLILAGWFATRLWPITEKRSKPLLILKDKEIISHIVENLWTNCDIIISTNKVFEKDFLLWLKKYPNRKIKIVIEDSDNDTTKKWALWATSFIINKLSIDEDLLLIAWDNYFWFNFNDFIANFKDNPLIATYDIKDKSKARNFGVIVSKDNKRVDSFEEKPISPSSTLVSTWAYIFPKANLADIIYYSREHNDDLWWIFEFLKNKWAVIDIFTFDDLWFDIGSFDGYLQAQKTLQNNKFIWSSTKILNSWIDYKCFIWADCKIKDSVISGSIIMEWCKISDCKISDSIIDKDCTIKWIDIKYKILREKSYISSDL